MGREAYLTRVVLGRSAFGDPLRDENGDLVLGGQARAFDDQSYIQQFDDRGHPQNLESERRSKQFRKAQNEVLAACGVVVRRDEDRKRTQDQTDVSDDDQLMALHEENNIGLMLKYMDRIAGGELTWWINSLRKRLTVYGSPWPSMTDWISYSFSNGRVAFFFNGYPAYIAAVISRLARKTEIDEPIECMNYLDFNISRITPSWNERFWEWLSFGMWMSFELPFELMSTLQSLGFSVLPAVGSALEKLQMQSLIRPFWLLQSQSVHRLGATIGLYLIRDYLHDQLGWRIYGLLRQVLPRPHRPTKLSIKAQKEDEFANEALNVGIGRSLGAGTDHRFYGPQSLWSALPVAFPWLSFIMKKEFDKDDIKTETLMRCAMMERNEGAYDDHRARRTDRRAENIIRNLESLGVDVEEDFYVDIDQWAPLVSSLEPDEDEEVEVVMTMPLDSGPAHYTNREDFLIAAEEYRQSLTREQQEAGGWRISGAADPTSTGDAADRRTVGEQDETDREAAAAAENTDPFTQQTEAPATPELGVRRATSLSMTTPRPVRRPTETNGPDFDDEMEAILAEARREKTAKKKVKSKDDRRHRITRLTAFATDSLAWHSSIIITNLVMLPIDAMYYRTLANWFVFATGSAVRSPLLAVGDWSGGVSGMSADRWRYHRMLLLSIGVECLVRGAIWQVGCQLALSYGRWFSWGAF